MTWHRWLWLGFLLPLALGAQDAPPWLRDLAALTVPGYDSKVGAAVLLKERKVTVEESGRVVTEDRGAVRILTREGRSEAAARQIYLTGAAKVRDLRGWMLYPSGKIKKYGKNDTADVALVNNDVYNEVRVRVLLAAGDADPGAVFGYEATSEDRSLFTQFEWQFQDDLPALRSRFILALPAGWRVQAVTFNHPEITPATSGSTYAWELRDLAPIRQEEAGPRITSIAPRLAISYFPAQGAAVLGPSFADWRQVSRWLTDLSDPQVQPSEALAAKARALAAEAKTEWERIDRIGRYTQGINYVSIQTGLGRRGGYRPHSAAEVFQKQYGDCKDKTNLVRALLKTVGIESYPVAVYAGDRGYVRPEWPSPQQFNHMIVAVKLAEARPAPAIGSHQARGPLLFFDPTDEHTPVGELPESLQNSFGLVVAGDAGALLRLPAADASASRLDREVDMKLDGEGSIVAHLVERSVGGAAAYNRGLFRRQARSDYVKIIEKWIARGASVATVSKVEARDETGGAFVLEVDFSAPFYGQTMQNRLLVFRPSVVERYSPLSLAEPARKHPVLIDVQSVSETVRVQLPAGFQLDEAPAEVRLTASFGRFSASWAGSQNQVVFKRALELSAATIPPEQYQTVRDFFAQVRAAAEAPVVLIRK